jgi:hypothetical protein
MTQAVRQRLWAVTRMGDANSSLGRSHDHLIWTMEGQSQPQKGWIQHAYMHKHSVELGWVDQNWQQDFTTYPEQIYPELVVSLSPDCVHNKGGEFIGGTFQWLLRSFDIKDVQSTTKNPQSNSICKRMHQTVGSILRVLLYSNPPQNLTQARDIVNLK